MSKLISFCTTATVVGHGGLCFISCKLKKRFTIRISIYPHRPPHLTISKKAKSIYDNE